MKKFEGELRNRFSAFIQDVPIVLKNHQSLHLYNVNKADKSFIISPGPEKLHVHQDPFSHHRNRLNATKEKKKKMASR